MNLKRNIALVLGLVVIALLCAALWIALDDWLSGPVRTQQAMQARGQGQDAEGRRSVTLRGSVGPLAEHGGLGGRPTPDDTAETASLTLIGRVVDERGLPVEGAVAEVRDDDGLLATGKTTATGRLQIRLALPQAAGTRVSIVHVRDDQGQATAKSVDLAAGQSPWLWGPEGRGDLGTLVLRPTYSVQVLVMGGGASSEPVQVLVVNEWNAGMGAPLYRASGHLGEVLTLPMLPRGAYRLSAIATGYGLGKGGVSVPREDVAPVEIQLPPEHTLHVTVVDHTSGVPVQGAQVEVFSRFLWPSGIIPARRAPQPSVALTDAQGGTWIRGLSAKEDLYVRARDEGYELPRPTGSHPSTTRVRPGTEEVRLELVPSSACRWPVVAGELAVPPDGSSIRFFQPEYPLSVPLGLGRVEGGFLIADRLLQDHVRAFAVSPDGGLARLELAPDEHVGSEVSFFRPRALDVVLHTREGAPVEGMFVTLAVAGWGWPGGGLLTDAEGRAQFRGLYAGKVRVEVKETMSRGMGRVISSLDLADGDAQLDAVVESECEVLVRVTAEGHQVLPPVIHATIDGRSPAQLEVDPTHGEMRFAWRPADPAAEGRIQVRCRGYMPVTRFIRASDPQPLVVDLELVPSGHLVVNVTPPEDGRCRLSLQQWDTAQRGWRTLGRESEAVHFNEIHYVDPSNAVAFDSLEAGRYRIVDASTGLATLPLEVRAGGAPAVGRLDLSTSGFVQGTVLGPDGAPAANAKILIRDADATGAEWRYARGSTREDGGFRVRVGGDREVLLKATHRIYSASRERGAIRVQHPQVGLVLRLDVGPTARIRFSRALVGVQVAGRGTVVPVHLYRGEGLTEEVAVIQARLAGSSIEFGGYEPGRYTVWIDANPYAPVILPAVALHDGITELGQVHPQDGTTILLAVHFKDSGPRPLIHLKVVSEAGPNYERSSHSRDSPLRLSGVGSGRVTVDAWPHGDLGSLIRRTLEVAEGSQIEMSLDMRD